MAFSAVLYGFSPWRPAPRMLAGGCPTRFNSATAEPLASSGKIAPEVVATINVGIDYAFIGTPFAAGVLVILQVVVNTTKFFFNEMMWQEISGISPLQRAAPDVIEFGNILVAASAP